jgi:hypothetical protein
MGMHRSRAYSAPIASASDRPSVVHRPTSSTCPRIDPVLVVVAASESTEINQPLSCSGNEIGKNRRKCESDSERGWGGYAGRWSSERHTWLIGGRITRDRVTAGYGIREAPEVADSLFILTAILNRGFDSEHGVESIGRVLCGVSRHQSTIRCRYHRPKHQPLDHDLVAVHTCSSE